MKIAIITAGGAGMFCGSCMQDNTLARTLRLAGEDAVLVPTYTPIRVDEEDVSIDQVFLGGVNVYLDSTLPGWKRLPRWMTSWLNRPSLIRFLAKFGNNTDAAHLGALTLDMLRGIAGPQKREVTDFAAYLCDELKPDVIVFSNALLSGVLSELRPKFTGRILCLLQGDDIFLEGLSDQWKQPVMDQLSKNCDGFDGFLTHSSFYASFMARYLNLPADRFRQIPLTIDVTPNIQSKPADAKNDSFCIGYFARICPEKGIQNLLAAAEVVLPNCPGAFVRIAGFLPDQHRSWFEQLLADSQEALPGRIEYLGSPSGRSEKFDVISSFNMLCVPTNYFEPKGLFVLEAALMNVPSLVPAHGAFPELIERLGCGRNYDSKDATGLNLALRECIERPIPTPTGLADSVAANFGMQTTAEILKNVIYSF